MMKLISKKLWGKRKEMTFRRRSLLIHRAKVMYITTILEKDVSSENIYIPSISSQIVGKVLVIQEIVLPGVSKMIQH